MSENSATMATGFDENAGLAGHTTDPSETFQEEVFLADRDATAQMDSEVTFSFNVYFQKPNAITLAAMREADEFSSVDFSGSDVPD